jgi:hypothetical protein
MGSRLELIESAVVTEIYVDGWADYEVNDGVVSCVGYRKIKGSPPMITARLIFPVRALADAISQATACTRLNMALS